MFDLMNGRNKRWVWIFVLIFLAMAMFACNEGGSSDNNNDSSQSSEDTGSEEETSQDLYTWYKDSDNDGYSDGQVVEEETCPDGYKAEEDLVSLEVDCNDENENEFPGQTWYKDYDDDGYSDGDYLVQCLRPDGYKLESELFSINGDDDDTDPNIQEFVTCYKDVDGDQYSDGASVTQGTCPADYFLADDLIATSGDCNDEDPEIHPNAYDWCEDGIDQDCQDGDRACPVQIGVDEVISHDGCNEKLVADAYGTFGEDTIRFTGNYQDMDAIKLTDNHYLLDLEDVDETTIEIGAIGVPEIDWSYSISKHWQDMGMFWTNETQITSFPDDEWDGYKALYDYSGNIHYLYGKYHIDDLFVYRDPQGRTVSFYSSYTYPLMALAPGGGVIIVRVNDRGVYASLIKGGSIVRSTRLTTDKGADPWCTNDGYGNVVVAWTDEGDLGDDGVWWTKITDSYLSHAQPRKIPGTDTHASDVKMYGATDGRIAFAYEGEVSDVRGALLLSIYDHGSWQHETLDPDAGVRVQDDFAITATTGSSSVFTVAWAQDSMDDIYVWNENRGQKEFVYNGEKIWDVNAHTGPEDEVLLVFKDENPMRSTVGYCIVSVMISESGEVYMPENFTPVSGFRYHIDNDRYIYYEDIRVISDYGNNLKLFVPLDDKVTDMIRLYSYDFMTTTEARIEGDMEEYFEVINADFDQEGWFFVAFAAMEYLANIEPYDGVCMVGGAVIEPVDYGCMLADWLIFDRKPGYLDLLVLAPVIPRSAAKVGAKKAFRYVDELSDETKRTIKAIRDQRRFKYNFYSELFVEAGHEGLTRKAAMKIGVDVDSYRLIPRASAKTPDAEIVTLNEKLGLLELKTIQSGSTVSSQSIRDKIERGLEQSKEYWANNRDSGYQFKRVAVVIPSGNSRAASDAYTDFFMDAQNEFREDMTAQFVIIDEFGNKLQELK